MFIIGIDPHKGSHTAAVIDRDERLVGELSVRADRRQRDRLLRWAAPFEPRLWAVEGATGHGALLAQQLVASGETVVDVPAALSARARLLDSGRKDKTDPHDAALGGDRCVAAPEPAQRSRSRITVRCCGCWRVGIISCIAARTRAICRLHAVLAEMVEGGLSKNLSAKRAAAELRKLRPARRDRDRTQTDRCRSSSTKSAASTRRSIELHGRIDERREGVEHVGHRRVRCRPDRRVLPDRLHAATFVGSRPPGTTPRYNATAPIEASSGPKVRHRLNPNGNRQLNHAIHIAALGQISHDTPGRAYYLAKQADGKSRKEAMRCLKRRISDAVYRQLRADLTTLNETGPGRQSGATLKSSAAGRSLNTGTSERSFPDPTPQR